MPPVPQEASFLEGIVPAAVQLPDAERPPAGRRTTRAPALRQGTAQQAPGAWGEATAVLAAAQAKTGKPPSDSLRLADSEPAEANGPQPHESGGGPRPEPCPLRESLSSAGGCVRWLLSLPGTSPLPAKSPQPHEIGAGPPQDLCPPRESSLRACGSARWLYGRRPWLLLELLPAAVLLEAPQGPVA